MSVLVTCGFLVIDDVTSPWTYPVAMDTCMYADQTESWKYSCTDDVTYKHTYTGTNDCSGTPTSTVITSFPAYDIHCGSGDQCDIAHVYFNFYDKAPGTDNECPNLSNDPYYFDSKPFVTGYMPLVLNQCSSFENQWTMYSCKDTTTLWSAVEYFTGKATCDKTAYTQYSFGDSSCSEDTDRVMFRQDVIATMCRPEPTGAPTADPTTAAPTDNPLTSAPTASPITSAPTASPVSQSPTATPITASPVTAIPTTALPTTAPVRAVIALSTLERTTEIRTTKTPVAGSSASSIVCVFAFKIMFVVLLHIM